MTDPSLPAAATAAASGLDFPVVGIGASAGGLAAVQTLLGGLPAAPDMAFVVVMHLSPKHESNAAAIFQTRTRMNVSQVQGSVKIERDHVYVIPPNQDLQMVDGALSLKPVALPRPPRHVVIDLFFRTLADAHGDRAIGILLSGTGSDGSAGIARLKEQGGIVIAQAPNDAEYEDLPRNAIATGKVDIVLPAADMASRLLELWRNTRRIEIPGGRRVATDAKPPQSPDEAEAALRDVMKLLLQRTGHDFRNYKRATVLRRVERRLQVNAVPDLPAYREFLESEPAEAKALLDDMLIGVTQFFRDRAAFEALEREVVPKLFEAGPGAGATEAPVRAWVAGCSTGEEAYSVAMLLADEAALQKSQRPYTVFATDLDERAIAWGRAGLYPDAVSVDVPPARLRTYFAAEPGGFRIHKSLRERLIFAPHDLLRDPPFSNLDLVTCRNVLIYLDRQAQQAALDLFHFALRPGGYLFLGTSETVDASGRLFSPVDKAMRIYRANPVSRSPRPPPPMPVERAIASTPISPRVRSATGERQPTPAGVHQQLLENIAPPSILIDHEHDILHVSGQAARFLRYGAGEPSHSLPDAVDSRIATELRTLLFQSSQLRSRVESAPLPFATGPRPTVLQIVVQPVRHDAWPGELTLVTLDEVELPGELPPEDISADPALARLETELARRSEQLRAVIEQYEASSEELKASNEELQASNEELRSATEELETSKEELQSTNEELITVNHELKTKIDEAGEANDDLKNLVSSSDVATVFVDPTMRIKRFTPAAAAVFNIIAADVGRSLFDITHKLDYDGLAEDAHAVFASLHTIEREVKSADGRVFLARLLPYRTADNRIGGAILNLIDVTSLRRAQADAGTGADRMELVADAMAPFAILTLDRDGACTSWNIGASRLFGWSAEEMIGQPFDRVFTPEDRAAGVPREEMRIARERGHADDDRWLVRKDGSRFFVSGVLAPLRAADGYAKICRDMSEVPGFADSQAGELAEAQRGAAENRLKNEFLAVMSHELKHPLNLIGINAQLLATLPEAQGLPAVARAARVIQRTVQSQGRIIDDLLDMSRVNTGKLALNRAPLLLAEAIQTAMNWAVAEARNKGVRIYSEGFDEPMLINADAIRIEQIAWNLLSNAIKFSRSGGAVTVRVGHDATEAWLEVTDSGRGIDAESLPHVFDMFRQVDSASTRGEGGLGIGLALVKSLVELHGGRVEATSPGLGQGATFRAVLPLQQTHDVSPLVDRAGPAAVDRLRILLVDDTADTLETFGYLLEHAGHAVRTAGSAAEALELLSADDFDLVLSDVGMPGVDGYQMLESLRRGGGRNAGVPAIALTGYGRPQDVQRAFAAGFQAHVDKPVDLAQLAGVMGTVLAGSPAKGTGKGKGKDGTRG